VTSAGFSSPEHAAFPREKGREATESAVAMFLGLETFSPSAWEYLLAVWHSLSGGPQQSNAANPELKLGMCNLETKKKLVCY
jgi:hypothetical protein